MRKPSKRRLGQVQGHKFVAGFILNNGIIVEAAPILRRYLNKSISDALFIWSKKGWHAIDVGPDNSPSEKVDKG